MNKIKFNLWWGHLRHLFQKYVLKKHDIDRQPYFIAKIFNPNGVFKKLILIGFQPNYFAFHDKGEIYNLRRLKHYGDELWQEHVRVFSNEIRGHWEITYEADAVLHYKGGTVIHLPSEIQKEIAENIGQS